MERSSYLIISFQFFFFRKTSEDQGHCHSQSRNQRKRLEHIEAILEKLSRHSATKFDPQEMLACGYLRLSKHNIETLENMIKDSGHDPGIHAHSDVREYDLWADIKRENELEQAAAHAPSASPTKKIKGWSVGSDYARSFWWEPLLHFLAKTSLFASCFFYDNHCCFVFITSLSFITNFVILIHIASLLIRLVIFFSLFIHAL